MLGGSLIGISLFFGITAGSYFGYEILRPKNLGDYLLWKGYRLVEDDSTWNATYLEHGFNEFKNIEEFKSLRVFVVKN